MAYAEIPRDVLKIKRRVVAGLTKRQLVCILIAAAIGLPLFFLLRKPLGSSPAAYVMVFAMIPAMLFAFLRTQRAASGAISARYAAGDVFSTKTTPVSHGELL